MAELPFAKGHALGTDLLILEAADLPWPLTPERIRRLCDRRSGIGSAGILLAIIGADRFQFRVYNPDGSENDANHGALPIFAAYLHERGLIGEEPFDVLLPDENITMRVRDETEPPGHAIQIELQGAADAQLDGPAQIVYRGVIRPEIVASW